MFEVKEKINYSVAEREFVNRVKELDPYKVRKPNNARMAQDQRLEASFDLVG